MDEKQRPLVSIGVPTYNRVGRLERGINLMLEQDYENLEIVVSDNASTDGTQAFCEELARKDTRIRYRRQPHNIGGVRNYAEVLKIATGDLYMNLADDDDLERSYVSKCVDALQADRSLSVVAGRALMYQDGTFVHESTRTMLLEASPSERVLSYYRTVTDNAAFHGIVRRSLLSGLPAMPSVIAGDWLFIASVAFTGRIKTIDDTSIVKHMGGTSASLENIARVLGLSPRRGRYAVEGIIVNVFCDIAWESPVYASLGPVGRLRLATAAAAVLVARFGKQTHSATLLRAALVNSLPPGAKRKLRSMGSAVRDAWR